MTGWTRAPSAGRELRIGARRFGFTAPRWREPRPRAAGRGDGTDWLRYNRLVAIDADRNSKWLPDWRDYHARFEGVPFHAEVQSAFEERVEAHNEAADELWDQAEEARDIDDAKAAIQACLEIRDDCFVADGESVTKAKALLAAYREDKAVAKKHRRLLEGTEEWK